MVTSEEPESRIRIIGRLLQRAEYLGWRSYNLERLEAMTDEQLRATDELMAKEAKARQRSR